MTKQGIDKPSRFEAVRTRLIALAYRMLGSRAEAEDVVQDVWLKWHLADTAAVQTPAAWLTTLTTRTAIDRLRHLQRERASQATGWLPEPWLDEVAPSAEELALRAAEMSYGVMLLLERLKPDERAAFVLHEAFDCDYAEIATILERTPAACRQIVHRARMRLRRAGAPLERPDPAAHARIVERLRAALEEQDRAGLLRLFSEAPEVSSDAPVCAREPVMADWVEQVTSLARQASHAEVVSVEGATGIALLSEGEVIGVINVSTAGPAAKIVALRVVTSAARLRATNLLLGRAAVTQLLTRIQQNSTAVRGDFPVDVHA
ncbi:MAG TPA: sigma-70 family RNA polymerase sigma factor [Paraburkholderia sp.]|jgi:RNA polymerase sigma-70 factor (ECF subfamily)|nr:sigma-70 family RNA polymerase sigma factor [Paraburkholderia sp.]